MTRYDYTKTMDIKQIAAWIILLKADQAGHYCRNLPICDTEYACYYEADCLTEWLNDDITQDEINIIKAKTEEEVYMTEDIMEKAQALTDLAKIANSTAIEHGWWEDPPSFGEIIALCHSELSEALAEYRAGTPAEYKAGRDRSRACGLYYSYPGLLRTRWNRHRKSGNQENEL